MKLPVILSGLAVFLSIIGRLPADDWPTWRHDRERSGVTGESLELPLRKAWYFRSRFAQLAPRYIPVRTQATAKFGLSEREPLPEHARYALAVIAVGDAVYFSSHDGRVVCLDAKTGQVRWEFLAAGAITCAPYAAEGKIWAGSDDGYIYCLDAKTGKQEWKYKAVKDDRWFISFGRLSSIWPVRTDVLVDKGTAYFGAGIFPHDGMYVNALDVKARKPRWRSVCYAYGFAGHIFAAEDLMVLPTEFKGFHGHQLSYNRADGSIGGDWSRLKEHRELLQSGGGVVAGGIRVTGRHGSLMAWKTENEHEPGGRKNIWVTHKRSITFDPRDTAMAGGVAYLTGSDFEQHGADAPVTGTGGAVFAIAPEDGKELWSARIPERPHHMAIAGGKLFLSTRQGTIYCFASQKEPAQGVIDEPIETPFAGDDDLGQYHHVAHRLLGANNPRDKGVGLPGEGFALVLDCTTGKLPYVLALRSRLNICAVFDDEEDARRARVRFSHSNLHCSRISVWFRREGQELPYSPNFADVILSEQAALGGALPVFTPALERLLKPIRGVALFGGKGHEEAALVDWARKAKLDSAQYSQPAKWTLLKQPNEPSWVKFVRPPLAGAGGWTHANGTPGNTMCSHDDALKPPLGIVWYGPPYSSVMFSRPPLVHKGVLVCPVDPFTVEGYDVYNGRRLWSFKPPLNGQPDGFRNFQMMAVGGDSLFIPDGNVIQEVKNKGVLRLDLWTGKVLETYPPPFPEMRMGHFAVSPDGKTFWRSGYGDKTEKAGDWTCMFAVDVESGRILWMAGGPGKKKPFGLYRERVPYERWSSLGDGRIYTMHGQVSQEQRDVLTAEMKAYLEVNDPEAYEKFDTAPKQLRLLIARDAMTGEVLYEHAVDIQGCDQVVIARSDKVLFCTTTGSKWWTEWPRKNFIAAHDGATGKLLWKKPANYRFDPVVTDDTIYAEPWAFDLATGRKRQRIHPITGEPGEWSWVRSNKQCGGCSGSTHFLFGRNKGFGYHDALRDHGMYTSWHHRQACNADTSSGSGMMLKPPFNTGCGCPWSMPFTMAMTKVDREPAIPFECFLQGRSLPVKHLRVNFGANGDRRDAEGNMWIHTRRRTDRHKLSMSFFSPAVFYPGGDGSLWGNDRKGRLSAGEHPVANTKLPIVFDAFARGLKRYCIPVTTPADGRGVYTVRLGFSALPGDRPGQRVFDVKLNGKVVHKDFDIVEVAGAAGRAVWTEHTLSLDDHLILDLVARSEEPGLEQMPLISGLELRREEITTLGLEVAAESWLGLSRPELKIPVKLANLRAADFKGRLVIEAPGDISVKLPAGGAVDLASGSRAELAVELRGSGKPLGTSHTLSLKLVSTAGRTELERRIKVDWLGSLERRVFRGSTVYHAHPEGRKEWMERVRPPHYAGELPVSNGFAAAGDKGAVDSYLSFNFPREIGKIHQARVRLRVASELGAIHQAVFGLAPPVDEPVSAGAWGALRHFEGPPWRSANEFKYPSRPPLRTARNLLAPAGGDSSIVETSVSADLPRDENGNGTVHFAIEPTALNGPVYWSSHGWDIAEENRPTLVLDYEPVKDEKK